MAVPFIDTLSALEAERQERGTARVDETRHLCDLVRVSGTGSVLNMRATGASSLVDIDLDNNAQLVIGGGFGDVILTTTSVASATSFNVGLPVHVAFVTPLTAVPEPSTALLLASGLAVLAGSRLAFH